MFLSKYSQHNCSAIIPFPRVAKHSFGMQIIMCENAINESMMWVRSREGVMRFFLNDAGIKKILTLKVRKLTFENGKWA